MKQEIFAEQIFSPNSSGKLRRFSYGRIIFSKKSILEVKSFSARDFHRLSKKKKVYRCIIPGLVDPHTHLVFAGNRTLEWAQRLKGISYQEIAKKGGGIKKSVQMTRDASEAELVQSARKRLKDLLSFGVCSLEIKSGYGLDLKTELRTLKIIRKLQKKTSQSIRSTFLGAHALPKEWKDTSSYVDWIIENVLPQVKGLADFQDVFVEQNYFGVKESIRLLEAGKKFGLIPKVHAHEFGRTGGVEVAVRVGAVSADHLQYMSDHDISRMKKARVIPVVLPGTSMFLGGKKFAPAKKMWDAGLKVAIASDFNPGTNPSLNIPLMGSLAAIFEALDLDQVLVAQTYHAALALGYRDRGILEKGFRPDFVALDAASFEEMYYHYGQNLVEAVYIHGKKVL